MSAVPKPTKDKFESTNFVTDEHSREPSRLNGLFSEETLSSLSSSLKGAAFVSSEGRVYRLFPENEKTPFGNSFSLPQDKQPDLNQHPESTDAETSKPPSNRPNASRPDISQDVRSTLRMIPKGIGPSPCFSTKASVDLPIDEAIRRIRAVEGICRQKTGLSERIFESPVISAKSPAKSAPVNRNPPGNDSNAKSVGAPVQAPCDIAAILNDGIVPSSDLPENIRESENTVRIFSVVNVEEPGVVAAKTEPAKEPFCLSIRNVPGISNVSSMVSDIPVSDTDDKPLPAEETLSLERFRRGETSRTETESEDESDSELVRSVRMIRLNLPGRSTRRFRKTPFEKSKSTRFPESAEEYPDETDDSPMIVPFRVPEEESERNKTEIESKASDVVEAVSGAETFFEAETIVEETPDTNICTMHAAAGVCMRPVWPSHLELLKRKANGQIGGLSDHLEHLGCSGKTVVSFNSVCRGDGCTTLLLCASRELARRGFRVLAVDACAENAEIPRLLDIALDANLCQIVELENRLELLPWTETSIEIDTADGKRFRSFGDLIGTLRHEYDFILLDNGCPEKGSFDRHVQFWRETGSDGVLLVVNTRNSSSVELRDTALRLQEREVALLGIAENYVLSSAQ